MMLQPYQTLSTEHYPLQGQKNIHSRTPLTDRKVIAFIKDHQIPTHGIVRAEMVKSISCLTFMCYGGDDYERFADYSVEVTYESSSCWKTKKTFDCCQESLARQVATYLQNLANR